MIKLESLITELKEELQELEDNRGTRFPMIEQATDIQIAYITKELSDLEMLQEHEGLSLNENQQIVLDWLIETTGTTSLMVTIALLNDLIMNTGNWENTEAIKEAYVSLTRKQETEVLQAFAEWGLGHERN